jgi:hypothetical protein
LVAKYANANLSLTADEMLSNFKKIFGDSFCISDCKIETKAGEGHFGYGFVFVYFVLFWFVYFFVWLSSFLFIFRIVYLGEWNQTPIALKCLKNSENFHSYVEEVRIMRLLAHPNCKRKKINKKIRQKT